MQRFSWGARLIVGVGILVAVVIVSSCDATPGGPGESPISPLAGPDGPDEQVTAAPSQPREEVPELELSGGLIAAVCSTLISLMYSYVPQVHDGWKQSQHKKEIWAAMGAVSTATIIGLHYLGAIDLGIGAFGWPVIWYGVETWLAFAGAGQLTYTATESARS